MLLAVTKTFLVLLAWKELLALKSRAKTLGVGMNCLGGLLGRQVRRELTGAPANCTTWQLSNTDVMYFSWNEN